MLGSEIIKRMMLPLPNSITVTIFGSYVITTVSTLFVFQKFATCEIASSKADCKFGLANLTGMPRVFVFAIER